LVSPQSDGLFVISSDATDDKPRLLVEDGILPDWTPDSRYLVYVRTIEDRTSIWYVPLNGDQTPMPLVQSPSNAYAPQVSSDGQYVAYHSDESGRDEVYVTTFPHSAQKSPVSVNGGRWPRWSMDGQVLYYVEGHKLMATKIQLVPTFSSEFPKMILTHGEFGIDNKIFPKYDVHPDRRSFLVTQTVIRGDFSLVVVQNWFKEFEGQK